MELCSGLGMGQQNSGSTQTCLSLDLFPGHDELPSNGRGRIKNTKTTDICVASSRSSIRQLHDVLSSFDAQKREVVRSIGFEGILLFPALKQINRRFAVWLMSKVDPVTQTIAIDSSKQLYFSKKDIDRVFGIPCNGRSVFSLGTPSKQTISSVTAIFLPGRAKENRSVKVAQDILEKQYPDGMSQKDADAFRVAFVIYIVSTLLCPGSKHGYVSVDYWNALTKPSVIKDYDWSEYVLKRLMQAVVKVKTELASSNKVTNINGCSIFLQVLYLDSIDVGMLNLDHSAVPRMRDFNSDVMKSMILANTMPSMRNASSSEFGKCKLRRSKYICYAWATKHQDNSSSASNSVSPALNHWVIASTFARVLGFEALASGPLFFAVSEFEGCRANKSWNNAALFTDVLTSIIETFTNSFCYNVGRELNTNIIGRIMNGGNFDTSTLTCTHWDSRYLSYSFLCCDDMIRCTGDHQVAAKSLDHPSKKPRLTAKDNKGPSGSSSTNSTTEPEQLSGTVPVYEYNNNLMKMCPYDLVKNMLAITCMGRYFLVTRCMNKNLCAGMAIGAASSGLTCTVNRDKTMAQSTTGSPDESDLNSQSAETSDMLHHVADILIRDCNVPEENWPVLLHFIPKHIEVSLKSFKAQLDGESELVMDMVDGLIRRFHELECVHKLTNTGVRRKHFFETDFVGTILAGCFNPCDRNIIDQVLGPNIGYDVRSCDLLFFPALLGHRWVCYTWDLLTNTITIFDPSLSAPEEKRALAIHKHVVTVLKNAVKCTMSIALKGWCHNWDSASIEVLCPPTRTTKS